MFPASTSSRRISSFSVVMFPGMKSCTEVVSRAATVSTSDACELWSKVRARYALRMECLRNCPLRHLFRILLPMRREV